MATPPASEKPTKVTVQKGDTLSEIAQEYLGKASEYKKLAAINNIPNADLIYVGQVIKLYDDGESNPDSSNSNKPVINQFGHQSDTERTLFATWSWSKDQTESYKVLWTYDTGDDVWFVGNNSSITVDEDEPAASRQSTYNVPDNAVQVRFKVKPIAKKTTKNGKETSPWTAEWSDVKTYDAKKELLPKTPGVPSVEIEDYTLTAELDNLDVDATSIQFQIVKDNATVFDTGTATIENGYAGYSCTVDAGGEYKVRARSCRDKKYSEWSNYSAPALAIPAPPEEITKLQAQAAVANASEISVYIEWTKSNTATSYDVEYTDKKANFEGSNQSPTRAEGIENTHFQFLHMEPGYEYFFRVRARNDAGTSEWTEPKSIIVGTTPSAPTTWSSTTKAIVGEPIILYWVHNTQDGSYERWAELTMLIGELRYEYMLKDADDSDKLVTFEPLSEEDRAKGKIASCSINTSDTSIFSEGAKITWWIKTAGITNTLSDESIHREIDVYTQPSLALTVKDSKKQLIDVVREFPFYIHALATPKTQAPIGYHVTVMSNEVYDTVDQVGNEKTVNQGEVVYSQYFDVSTNPLEVKLTAGNIDLANNIAYTVICTASMNSGLKAEASREFSVSWVEQTYTVNAEISIDEETYAAFIRPYCMQYELTNYVATKMGRTYTVTDNLTGGIYGNRVPGAVATTGEPVYFGTSVSGEEMYYVSKNKQTRYDNVYLSVYRREFDGTFTELATGIDGSKAITVTDAHPALDYARYRIVATDKATGAVSYYDPPGYPVQCLAAIIQWDEAWSNFDVSEDSPLAQPPWSGSMLKLMYNLDVSDSNNMDVALVEYIGREHPVSYYGTQIGQSSSWSMEIEKSDKETLYALRRLARWMGDVYVREPSGSGYWANISVSFNQKHRALTIPVTLNITRVEGGVRDGRLARLNGTNIRVSHS